MITHFTAADLRLSAQPRRPEPLPGDSAEVATAALVQLAAGSTVLTRGLDGEGDFDGIEIPLIDLAAWLAKSWAHLLHGPPPPSPAAARDERLATLAERWLAQRQSTDPLDVQQGVYDWAAHHALEFAATDYALPNLVVQRIDDNIELSWAAAPEPAPGSDVRFTFSPGRAVIPWLAFRDFSLALLRWVDERCAQLHNDPRLIRVRAVLALNQTPPSSPCNPQPRP